MNILGRADLTREQDRFELATCTDLTFRLITDHAHHEDDHLFARLEERVPGATSDVEHDHSDLAARAEDLHVRVAALARDPQQPLPEFRHALSLDLLEFAGDYLRHMALEEREIEPLLLAHFTDEELAEIQVAIAASMTSDLLLDWFRACAPARSISDNAVVLMRLQGALPPDAYAAVHATVASVLSTDDLARIGALMEA